MSDWPPGKTESKFSSCHRIHGIDTLMKATPADCDCLEITKEHHDNEHSTLKPGSYCTYCGEMLDSTGGIRDDESHLCGHFGKIERCREISGVKVLYGFCLKRPEMAGKLGWNGSVALPTAPPTVSLADTKAQAVVQAKTTDKATAQAVIKSTPPGKRETKQRKTASDKNVATMKNAKTAGADVHVEIQTHLPKLTGNAARNLTCTMNTPRTTLHMTNGFSSRGRVRDQTNFFKPGSHNVTSVEDPSSVTISSSDQETITDSDEENETISDEEEGKRVTPRGDRKSVV